MIESSLGEVREVTDTAKEMSLVVCVSCWIFKEEAEFKVPKELRRQNKTTQYRMLGGWYAKCISCRREE